MPEPRLVRKKPVEVEAMHLTVTDDAIDWMRGHGQRVGEVYVYGKVIALLIDTLEGMMRAEMGDWIIRGVKGEFYPCKPDVFDLTYELVTP